ncbi:hydantoinase/oxoprolinase family protein [uncultured Tateyamaria sp.]|uniref:hydantoinase/oxoprolinase family protein n=1 Tax=uncultured Tateyamaria sp. TaxID=455651 RepID=UPI0026184584|nr:hydantoinase/oxoprolinase family protein [uncultured Tateyamaria sp.]
MNTASGVRLAIDIGGTFTDTVLMDSASRVLATTKTPTTPDAPARAALEGAQQVLGRAGCGWGQVSAFIHGTTLATNALIERRGARVATITTAGFRDILEIAYERRYSQYATNIEKPDLIVPRKHALTIGGRMDAQGREIAPLDESAVASLVDTLRHEGIEAVAICLLHSYANPAHELRLADLLRAAMPELVLSLSHDVSPEAREFDRLCTTIANAYIQPLMSVYLADIQTRFAAQGLQCPVLMMTAGGGMTTLETASRLPIRLVESGPAGGAILAARLAAESDVAEVLSFDMGGTTAKLALIDDFRPQMSRKFEISRAARFVKGSGMPVRIPVIEMIEIGAGGGSIASVDSLGRVAVGPHSAGSVPGPVGFGKGGTEATVTDADIALGYIDPDRFAEGRLRIDRSASEAALATRIGSTLDLDAGGAATAVTEIVDESMASAARMHAVESGKNLLDRVMIAFGGNGPLHATRLARRAGVGRILVPRDPGVGSAVGFLFAPVSFEIIRSHYTTLDGLDVAALNTLLATMLDEATAVVRAGAPDGQLHERRVAFMRYKGQGHEIEIALANAPVEPSDIAALKAAFEAEYSRQFGRRVPGMTIEVLNWGLSVSSDAPAVSAPASKPARRVVTAPQTRSIWCNVTDRWCDAGLFMREALKPGDQLTGPALIIEPQTTTLVTADFGAEIDMQGNIWLHQIAAEDMR